MNNKNGDDDVDIIRILFRALLLSLFPHPFHKIIISWILFNLNQLLKYDYNDHWYKKYQGNYIKFIHRL